ncbi:hypothetical protein SLEP1_g2907 [Rubroshorea leprosula]|uniref:tRNA/rRNA methyltransferase SpoU type domain-containing protein n=1 Tax=Rubroshorea leprosula TaxID=152421 RepID=A0AAV5HPN9_9ROSI|nr:hypothetical protein SLEP1_g2907 [Rubroshorea leprosula]
MDTSALRTLNALTPLRSRFQSRTFGFGSSSSSSSPQVLRSKFHSPLAPSSSFSFHRLSPLCSLSENVNGSALPPGVGEAVAESSKKILHVVLVSPQIPGNTGSIARTCAASAVGLHLVGPLGFPVDDTKLKRAGLDYWPFVVVKVHGSWTEFRDYFEKQEGDKRLLAFTKRGTTIHSEFSYRKGDYLVFGSETKGLPPEALVDCKSNSFGGGTIRIPMVDTYVRCLNLSVSVGISVYEASRQLNYEQLQNPSESCIDGERCFNTEDIFA